MTKRRRMRLAEEQAAADAAERESAAEERKKRRGDLLAELDKAGDENQDAGGFLLPEEFESATSSLVIHGESVVVHYPTLEEFLQQFPEDQHKEATEYYQAASRGIRPSLEAMPPLSPSTDPFPDAEVKAITGSILRSSESAEATREEREELLSLVRGSSEVLPEVPWNEEDSRESEDGNE